MTQKDFSAASDLAPADNSLLERLFKIKAKGSSLRIEGISGLTTFLAMVYSAIVVPAMFGAAGWPVEAVFISTCLVTGLSCILIGLWSNTPFAIGISISLAAYTAFALALGQGLTIPEVCAMVLVTGIAFFLISVSGARKWILDNVPTDIAHGAGIGIGLFILLIAASGVGLVMKNPVDGGLPVMLGHISSFPILMTIFGLFLTIALEAKRVRGGMLLVIIVSTVIGLIFDPNVKYNGFFSLPSLTTNSLYFNWDFSSIFTPTLLPIVFALVITSAFDATGTLIAVASEAKLVDKNGKIYNGDKALQSDSVANILCGLFGTAPAAVYIESAAGIGSGGKTGLTACIVGLLFLLVIFFQPLAALVPNYATAPALMYVGLLMTRNVVDLNFRDPVSLMAGLVTAVFIVLTANIVAGIMLGYMTLLVGRIFSGEWKKLHLSTIVVALILFAFYLSPYAL